MHSFSRYPLWLRCAVRPTVDLGIVAAVGGASLVSAWLLARRLPRRIWLASGLQLLQIIHLGAPGVRHQVLMGLHAGAAVVIRSEPVPAVRINFSAQPGGVVVALVGLPADVLVIGVNVVALEMFAATRRAASALRHSSASNGDTGGLEGGRSCS